MGKSLAYRDPLLALIRSAAWSRKETLTTWKKQDVSSIFKAMVIRTFSLVMFSVNLRWCVATTKP
jgi:hypothetical protein